MMPSSMSSYTFLETLIYSDAHPGSLGWRLRACLDCGQTRPYLFIGNDQKVGVCLDGCHFFGMPMPHYEL
jgi:hypothetical protein